MCRAYDFKQVLQLDEADELDDLRVDSHGTDDPSCRGVAVETKDGLSECRMTAAGDGSVPYLHHQAAGYD